MMEINLKKKYRLNTSFLENHFLELLPRERRSTVRTSHELALEAENRFRQAYERYENMRTRCLKAMGVEEDFFGGYRSFLIELLIPIINRVEKKIARRGPEFLEVKDFLRRRVGPVNYDHFLTDEPLGVYEISDDSSMEEFVHNEFSDGSVGSYWQTEEVDVWDIKRKATVEVRKRLRYEVKKNLADYKSDESISTDSEDWFATQLVKWHQYLNKEWREMKDRKAFDKAQARRLRKESWLRDLRRRASRKPPIKTILVRMPGNVNAIKDLADPRLELIRDRYFEMFDETLDETIDETFHNAFDKTCVGMFDDMFDVMFDEISGESSEDYISLTGQHAEKCYPYDVSTPTSEEEFDHSETWTPWEQQMLLLDTVKFQPIETFIIWLNYKRFRNILIRRSS
ncbi:hypothetical protein AAG570_007767 [Ranatra chinensis]|uniref:Uncharacterized protein n=1 Tax=Ranatra chinensis TaxID=642074 RepID=A0ABD0YGA5_9HEMI